MSFLSKFVYKPFSWIYENNNDIYTSIFTVEVSTIAALYYDCFSKLSLNKQLTTICIIVTVGGGGLLLLAKMKLLNFKIEIFDVQKDTVEERRIQNELLDVSEVASGEFKLAEVIDKFLIMKDKAIDAKNNIIKEFNDMNESMNDANKIKSQGFDEQMSEIKTKIHEMINKVIIEQAAMIKSYQEDKKYINDNAEMTINLFKKEFAEIQNAFLKLESETKNAQERIIETHRIQSKAFRKVKLAAFCGLRELITKTQNQLYRLMHEVIDPQLIVEERRIQHMTSNNVIKTIDDLNERFAILKNFSRLKKESDELREVLKEYNLVELLNDVFDMISKGLEEQNAAIPKALSHVTNDIYILKVVFQESMILFKSLSDITKVASGVEKLDDEHLNEFSILTNEIQAVNRIFEISNILAELLRTGQNKPTIAFKSKKNETEIF